MNPSDLESLLRARAMQLGLSGTCDDDLFEAVLAHDVQIPQLSDSECRRYYAQHADALRQNDLVEADHILFAVTPTCPLEPLRKKAEDTLNALILQPGTFADLARALSNCPSGQLGGNLGQLTREQCVPEFWRAIMDHGQPGLMPRLVRTRFGLHIVRIGRIAHGPLLPFNALREDIRQRLRAKALVAALQLYADDLQQQSDQGLVVHPDHDAPAIMG